MNTIFIGGSRVVTKLPPDVQARLQTIISQGHHVVVGDANGADKAVQSYLAENAFKAVTLFCSGDKPRNNVGNWKIENVAADSKTKDYQFFAAKDREMARRADFGLMIWDGKSPGTLLNIVRLVQAGKIAVLYDVPHKQTVNFKTAEQLRAFFLSSPKTLQADIQKRATGQEKRFLSGELTQPDFLETTQSAAQTSDTSTGLTDDAVQRLNDALSTGDMSTIIDLLGNLARTKGMSQVARDTNLARESLYRSLDAGGNPEFSTVLKVLTSLGIDLEARKTRQTDRDR